MATAPRVSASAGFVNLVLVVLSLNALAWLTARHLPLPPPWPDLVALGLALLGLAGLLLLSGLLHLVNPEITHTHGALATLVAVASGMLLVIPFTVLALIAELALGWSAAQPFATAAIMTGATGVGVELSRLGASRLANTVLPALAGGLFVAAWMLVQVALQGVKH